MKLKKTIKEGKGTVFFFCVFLGGLRSTPPPPKKKPKKAKKLRSPQKKAPQRQKNIGGGPTLPVFLVGPFFLSFSLIFY